MMSGPAVSLPAHVERDFVVRRRVRFNGAFSRTRQFAARIAIPAGTSVTTATGRSEATGISG
jgi:hypothetical protein